MKMQTMGKFRSNKQQGFTLIELIVVIVILGILAATALPKFANLGGDARVASLQAARGSLSSVSAMVHGKSLISGVGNVVMEGVSVAQTNGYPSADANLALAAGLTTADYTATVVSNELVVVPNSVAGTPAAATCNVKYTPATIDATTSVVTPPVILVTPGGC